MKAYKVQFLLPVNNPVDNIRIIRKKSVVVFEVPVNTPDLHELGYRQLVAWAEAAEKLALSTVLKNKMDEENKNSLVSKDANNPALRHRKRDSERRRADHHSDRNTVEASSS